MSFEKTFTLSAFQGFDITKEFISQVTNPKYLIYGEGDNFVRLELAKFRHFFENEPDPDEKVFLAVKSRLTEVFKWLLLVLDVQIESYKGTSHAKIFIKDRDGNDMFEEIREEVLECLKGVVEEIKNPQYADDLDISVLDVFDELISFGDLHSDLRHVIYRKIYGKRYEKTYRKQQTRKDPSISRLQIYARDLKI